MTKETVFACAAPALKAGPAAADEIGHDLQQYGVQRVRVVTDPGVEVTIKQQRLLATARRPVTEDDVAAILRASLELW